MSILFISSFFYERYIKNYHLFTFLSIQVYSMAIKVSYENLIAKPNIVWLMLVNINIHSAKFLGEPTLIMKEL